MIQNHSFKHQLIRDILTAIGTIVIFVWIIFSYKLYKQIFLINILDAAVLKLWHVWFNFGCFKHVCALKLIKYLRDPLKESKPLHSVNYYSARRLWLLLWFIDSDTFSKNDAKVMFWKFKNIWLIIMILGYQKCWIYCIFLGQKCSFHRNCHFHRKHLRIHVKWAVWIHGQHGLVYSRLWSQNQHHLPLGEHPYITFRLFFGLVKWIWAHFIVILLFASLEKLLTSLSILI